jgi:hypothetical protein
VQERLKQVLYLPRSVTLLGAQALKVLVSFGYVSL